MYYFLAFLTGLLLVLVLYDVTQRRHSIVRNFPLIGHLRYLLEHVGPELRQYIVTSNNEERPFSRDERRWIYASAKRQNSYFGFGTDNDLDATPNHVIFRHAAFRHPDPLAGEDAGEPQWQIAPRKTIGESRGRRNPYLPASIVNVSGMSYGALGRTAVEAINRGCKEADCFHNTGEGGLSSHHLHGADLVFQIGTGYFGCRDSSGRFSIDMLMQSISDAPVRAIEIKLSQGAKPGQGGTLPGAKVNAELARIRGVDKGVDCLSPPSHSAFDSVETMIEFVELVADATGLPVGIKSAVGEEKFWHDLAARMEEQNAGPDFITVDGGEGGTGAASLALADHGGLPFLMGFPVVRSAFEQIGLADDITFIGSGRLGLPDRAIAAFALGCDMVNVAREAMLSIGCIQAQRCHTGYCPSGVATQNQWLVRGLVPDQKYLRAANYIRALRKEVGGIVRTCGASHPADLSPETIVVLDGRGGWEPIKKIADCQ